MVYQTLTQAADQLGMSRARLHVLLLAGRIRGARWDSTFSRWRLPRPCPTPSVPHIETMRKAIDKRK